MAPSESASVRKAALVLHGLPAVVRTQVLARLEPAQTTRLGPLLEQLDTLRIPRALGAELQELAAAAPAGADSPGPAERAERLPPQLVERCLRSCAPVTVAWLLCARDWPWRGAVLERLSGTRRVEVNQHLRREWPPLAPAVLASLCERLCEEAACPPAPAAARADRHFMRRWFGWIP